MIKANMSMLTKKMCIRDSPTDGHTGHAFEASLCASRFLSAVRFPKRKSYLRLGWSRGDARSSELFFLSVVLPYLPAMQARFLHP